MFRVNAGETITRAATVAGVGTLSAETFSGYARGAGGERLTVAVTITDAAARQVTATINADQWARSQPGMGVLQILMNDGGAISVVHDETFRVMRGIAEDTGATDYGC